MACFCSVRNTKREILLYTSFSCIGDIYSYSICTAWQTLLGSHMWYTLTSPLFSLYLSLSPQTRVYRSGKRWPVVTSDGGIRVRAHFLPYPIVSLIKLFLCIHSSCRVPLCSRLISRVCYLHTLAASVCFRQSWEVCMLVLNGLALSGPDIIRCIPATEWGLLCGKQNVLGWRLLGSSSK